MKTINIFLAVTLTVFMSSCQTKMSDDEIFWKMSTEELVQKCLDYPLFGLMNAYNSLNDGFAIMTEGYNGFQELFSRDDAATELLKVYEKLDPLAVNPNWPDLKIGEFRFEFIKIEMFFNQKIMIDKLTDNGLRNLKEALVLTYKKKMMLPEMYYSDSLCPSVGACVQIIEKMNASLLDERRLEVDYLKYYLMVGIDNMELLDYIVEILENIEI